MNRGTCRRTTPISEFCWCVVEIETNRIVSKYITKPAADKNAKQFNELQENIVTVKKIKSSQIKEN